MRPKPKQTKAKKTKAGAAAVPKNETRAQRRQRVRDEYKAALKEFRSFHPDNQTRAYYEARARLKEADRRRASWWR